MNFDLYWLTNALGDVVWLALAFILGLLARLIGLPPLVGFLTAGFLLNSFGNVNVDLLQGLADIGITLLLFTVGLKINVNALIKPQVWAVASLHMLGIVFAFTLIVYTLAIVGLPFFNSLTLQQSVLIAFALSFSSTVFAVKALENKGEINALHGRIAIGILVVQDIAAVVFLTVSSNTYPSIWAFLLILLIPLRWVLFKILDQVGRGELLVLYGFILALGGAQLFELVEMKGDLGALIFGVMIATHPKADDMVKTMLGFKDLFLLGFFLSIGLSGELSFMTFAIGSALLLTLVFKSALFFGLLSLFKLRARTSLFTTINLSNFSEFGLIVMAVGAANGWINNQWLSILAIAMALSFVISALLSTKAQSLYSRYQVSLNRFQRQARLPEDSVLEFGDATVVVIGMGVIGTGAYDKMCDLDKHRVIGVDLDSITVTNQCRSGRNVLHGDPGDPDFWERVNKAHKLEIVMLTLPKLSSCLAVLEQLRACNFQGHIAAIAKFNDEAELLRQHGADTVLNAHTEAGAGFASDVVHALKPSGAH